MINYELLEYTKQKIQENSIYKLESDCIKIKCCFCGDSKKNSNLKRGTFYFKTGLFHCFNCSHTTDAFGLISELENKTLNKVKAEFFKYEKNGGGNFEYISTLPNKTNNTNKVLDIPEYWEDITTESKSYVDSRLILQAPNKPKYWKLYFNNQTNRLVIPWIKNNKIVYYQERALFKNQQPKYLFPKESSKTIFGIDEIDINIPYIYYTEGALDSIWIKNGISVGGLYPNTTQLEELSNYFTQELIYWPDNPWVDTASKNNIIKLSEKYKNLKIWMWPKNIKEKDINDVICKFGKTDIFYNKSIENNIISIQKARCILELN